jgi:hypothetical protein
MIKFSRVISRVKWLSGEKTNVSKTSSVLVLRALVLKVTPLFPFTIHFNHYNKTISIQSLITVKLT